MLLSDLARASADVAETPGRLAKIARLADVLSEADPEELRVAVVYLSGELPQGSIGVGWASLRSLPPPAAEPSLPLLEVDAALSRVAEASGPGSQEVRKGELAELFGRATEPERRFLSGLLLGELRQGALAGIVVEAVARATGVAAAAVRRARMLAGDLGAVAAAAAAEGERGLAAFRLTLLRPI